MTRGQRHHPMTHLFSPEPLRLPSPFAGTLPGVTAATARDERPDPPEHHGPRQHLRLRRDRGGACGGTGADLRRGTGLSGGWPARQGGGRSARTGTCGTLRHGSVAAAQAGAGKPETRRSAEGGQPFRPAHRPGRARGDGRAAARRDCRLCRAGRAVAGWHAEPGGWRAAGGDRGVGAGVGADLSRRPGRRGGLGRPHRSVGAERPACADQSFSWHPGADPTGPRRRRRGLARTRPVGRERHGNRQAGTGDRRGRQPQPAAGWPARVRQVDAGRAPARPAAGP